MANSGWSEAKQKEFANQAAKVAEKDAADHVRHIHGRRDTYDRNHKSVHAYNEDSPVSDFWKHYDKAGDKYDKRFGQSRVEMANKALSKVLSKIGTPTDLLPPNVRFRADDDSQEAKNESKCGGVVKMLNNFSKAGQGGGKEAINRTVNGVANIQIGSKRRRKHEDVPLNKCQQLLEWYAEYEGMDESNPENKAKRNELRKRSLLKQISNQRSLGRFSGMTDNQEKKYVKYANSIGVKGGLKSMGYNKIDTEAGKRAVPKQIGKKPTDYRNRKNSYPDKEVYQDLQSIRTGYGSAGSISNYGRDNPLPRKHPYAKD